MANRRFIFRAKVDGYLMLEVIAPDQERAYQKLADEKYSVLIDDTEPDLSEAELVDEEGLEYE